MDLIWLSHFIPYPARGGAAQRSFHLMQEAARHHRISLIAFNRPVQDAAMLAESRRVFERFCHRVEFWELPLAWRGPRWWTQLALAPLYRWPHSALAYESPETAQRWEAVLSEYPQALVHIDSSDLAVFIEPVLRLRTRFPTLLNHHNCESAMALRRASLESNPVKKFVLNHQARKLAAVEAALTHRVTLNLTVSDEDSTRLRTINPFAQTRLVENGTDVDYFHPQDDLLEERTIIFAASLHWYPNQSALDFFDREIWPLIKQRCPGVRFIVAGQKPPEFLVRWAKSDPAIELVPDPEDIRPCIARGSVYVCPILDGGGSRLKLMDAMAMGKAIVSTSVGAEGLRYRAGEHMLIADDPQKFADSVVTLMENSTLRSKLATAARRLALEEYSWRIIGNHLASAYAFAAAKVERPQLRSAAVATNERPIEKPRFSVVVPALNSYQYLPGSVDSILAAIESYGNADLTIVDNGSNDGSWELLSSRYSKQATVLLLKGVTISALRNRGAALSTGEFISFIDADCLIAPDYFDRARKVFAATGTDASGSRHLLPDSPHWIEETWSKLHVPSKGGATNYIPSGNFMVCRKAFEDVGGFDETLVTGEDAELCQRLWNANFSVHSSSEISAIHLGNPKALTQFFRKEVWHGLGMFGTFRSSWLDKPVLMTFAHLFLCVAAVLNLLFAPTTLALRVVLFLLLAIAAPAITVAYRFAMAGYIYRPIRSLWLYCLYLTARVLALFCIVERCGSRGMSRLRQAKG
jgi:glycosyltransferase involved in cell wall biosynthesis